MMGDKRARKKRKSRKGVNMNVKPGDHFVFEGGKGVIRFYMPRHIWVRRERQ